MSQSGGGSGSPPTHLGHKDEEFDKIFHPERFDPAALNPQGTGDIDQRQKYRAGEEPVLASLDGRHLPSQELPLDGHSRNEFASSYPAKAKKKSRIRKYSDSEEVPPGGGGGGGGSGGKRSRSNSGRRRKVSLAKPMPPIMGEEEEAGPVEDLSYLEDIDVDYDQEEDADEYLEERNRKEEKQESSLPWKTTRCDAPVLAISKDETPIVPEVAVATGSRKGSVIKFHIGEHGKEDDWEDDEQDSNLGYKQHHRIRKISKTYAQDKESASPTRNASLLVVPETEDQLPQTDQMDSHRFGRASGMSRHKIQRGSFLHVDHEQIGNIGSDEKVMRQMGYGHQKELDHTPHQLFVEMDELEGEEWVERARWIKYEEDLEAEAGRWGKPHVASLSFHSLINLRKSLESGVLLLDLAEVDLPGVVHRVVESLSVEGIIEEAQKPEILRVLTYRHKHVLPNQNTFRFGIKRNLSQRSLQGLLDNGTRGSLRIKIGDYDKKENIEDDTHHEENHREKDVDTLVDVEGGGKGLFRRNLSSSSSMKRSDSLLDTVAARNQELLDCLEEGTEGCLTLVGSVDNDRPIAAFVRLAKSIVMNNAIEVSLPMRFIFILLTPSNDFNMDCHEIGRSFSTLMSNPAFHEVCYRVEEKRELLTAINTFLDDSVVLPPGDWDKKHILPIAEITELRNRRKERKEKLTIVANGGLLPADKQPPDDDDEPPKRNPFERTRIPFGGLIDDIKQRYPHYLSDFKDGLNPQCFAATIFIYFASLSGAIAFGGLMGTKTKDDIGIPETLLVTSIAGIFFALLAGCPLIIVGVTGPLLLYDEALFTFARSNGVEFLSWRTWIGMWTFVVSMVVAGFQGSTLVKHFTKFTKDIFASLICLLFIYEALYKLYRVFKDHPLMEPLDYCAIIYTMGEVNFTSNALEVLENNGTNIDLATAEEARGEKPNPNTALLSAILMFGTFFIAYFLRIFRNSHYLGRNARRALGDFGVPIAIVITVMLDYGVQDTYTEKLKVPSGLQVTNNATRGWFIPPTGNQVDLQVWAMIAAILPGILLYIILFIETEICQLIIIERTKAEKGAGVHMDVVLLSFINIFCGFIGGPWICAATVRAVSHVSALIVMSTKLAPGESPKISGVRDQRLTACLVAILVGCSVMLSSILKLVPFAVLFGVFLYMGISGMNGVQFFDRLILFLMPVKHHPQVSYVKKVKTWRMVMFTIFQGIGLVVLWVVKSSPAALAFPFFVLAMVPFRLLLKFVFTEQELDALDGPQAGKDLTGEEEDKDFFEIAADCPVPTVAKIPLHKSIMEIMNLPVKTMNGLTSSTNKLEKIP